MEAALHAVRPICEAVRTRGVEAIQELSLRFDGVAPDDIRVPAAALADALSGLDPDVRNALEESIRRLRASCEAEREADVATSFGAATVTQRMVPVGRVGLYVPGGVAPLVSSVVMNVVPAQVAGVPLDRPRVLAAEGPRRPAAPDDPGGLRPARRRGGVRRRRRPGDRDVRLRRRPVRARRPGHRARLDPHGRRQAAAQGDRRHRLRGRTHRDRGAGRRQRRRGVRRRRPDQPGRARRARLERAGHAERAARRRRRGRAGEAGPRHPAHRPDPDRADVAAVGRRARRRPRAGTRGRGRARRRAPGDPDRGRRRLGRPGPQRGRGLRRLVRAGVAGRLLRGLQPRAADRRLRLLLLGTVGARVPQVRARGRLRPRRSRPGRRPCVALADAEDLPAHGAAVRVRFQS